jgi:hypothetical protein
VSAGSGDAERFTMIRKATLLAAALVIPGGLFALVATWLYEHLRGTERGRLFLARLGERLRRVRDFVFPAAPLQLQPCRVCRQPRGR